jgi:arylformamidase
MRNESGDTRQNSRWIDISVPLESGMAAWPGDTPFQIEPEADMNAGAGYNLSRLVMSSHAGTHIDAPRHFFSDGKTISDFPPEAGCGEARVLEFNNTGAITKAMLAPRRICRGERILFKTNNSELISAGKFREDYTYLTEDAADYLAERGIILAGIDYLSVAAYESQAAVHRKLLGAGIWIIECLNLSKIRPGRYEMVCLPLKISGADGAPARAAVKKKRSGDKL